MESEMKLVKDALRDGESGFAVALETYDKTFDPAMTRQVDAAGLKALLEAKNYAGFYAAIKEANPKRETYSPSALFLVLESMAGTWKMCGNSADGYTDVLVRKLIYDLRLWDAITNIEKYDESVTHYNSKHLRAFRLAFGLVAPVAVKVKRDLSPLPAEVKPPPVLVPGPAWQVVPADPLLTLTRPRVLQPLALPPLKTGP